MVQVEVLKDRCIGTGFCVAGAPAVFEFDEDGLAQARDSDGSPAEQGQLHEVAANCPADAILVTD